MGIIFEVDRLKKEAQVLRDILLQYKDQEKDANLCFNTLDPTIQNVLNGKVVRPIPKGDIDCGYYFTEGDLRPIPGMSKAYFTFFHHITGQDTHERRKRRAAIEKEIEDEKNNL
ncbi:MAG: hypothetical protein L3J75_15825 [Methylococcaceae bacterium]|nr:hypothetical protein [Methylococcaceae bacterium]